MEFEPLSMANEVIEFDMMGLGDIEHPVQEYELLRNSPAAASLAVVPPGIVASSTEPLIPEGDTNLEPYEGMEFESEEAAKAFYNSYARRVGFSTRVSMSRRSRRDGAIIQRSFVCAKEGFRVDKHDKQPVPDRDGRVKRPRAETRVGCKAMLAVKIQDSGRWVVSAFVKEHNHELVPPDKVHCLRSHRHVSGAAKSLIDTLQSAGIGPSGIMSALIKEYGGISNVGFTERDCRNYMRSSRQRTLGECQEKLSHVLSEHPSFEAELHKCVNLTESVEEFESCWLSIIDRYDLREHEWLQSVYSNRRQWVPVYLRDAFFAEMSITQRSDSMNSYFDGYVNASTTLQLFVKQYEKALESRYEKEVKADYDTINTAPVLKTPSPMEKQAAEFYTRKLFMKFQEELVETLTFLASKVEVEEETSTYQVAKFGESHKAYFVRFNVQEMKVNCSCQMFEFSGLLCRHILTVFRVTNVLTLPSRYILKRWTRNAKSGVVLEERASDLLNSSRESLTVRYNNLRQEALKYVDEGVKTVEIYNVAVRALQEAANKVAMVMKNGLKNVTVNGTAREDLFYQGSEVTNTLAEDEQDRKIHKLSRQLERSRRKCTVYRANLLSVLKDIEEQKLQLSVKVQNIKLGMKE
ncbi:hypothetical protein FEM48_Zijuj08G0074700 [Ziziphus jujuba var. spinosa]|uniref:Protein FAR1-RELATED SEQUENCE n=1 Tax=Ziziphus jujuba var. spinosa TaxID=714518 RepID=A0A978UXS6_ZIZJJ|nr:hypothetical protein FEM48_Zijuj08G0074700 [Ziziphus jujuba var. spinosa]